MPEIIDLGFFDSSKLWIKTTQNYLFKVDLFSDQIDLISTEGNIKYSTKKFLSIYTDYNKSLTQKHTAPPFTEKFNLSFKNASQIKYFDQYILVLYDSYLEIYNNDSGKKLIHATFNEPEFQFSKDTIFLVSNRFYKIFNNNIIYEFKK